MNSRVTDSRGWLWRGFVCRDMHSFLVHKMFSGICSRRPIYTTHSVACCRFVAGHDVA